MMHDPTYVDNVLAYGLDVRARRFILHGDIDHENEHTKNPVEHAVSSLLFLDRSDGEIEFWICTPGGDSGEMFGLYDIIRTCRNKIHTIGFGKIYSAGVLLLVAGDKRSATENAYLMSHAECGPAHYPSIWAAKQAVEAQVQMEKRWSELMARHTFKDKGWWYRLHQGRTHELWLDAAGMLEHGLIDSIVPDVVHSDGSRFSI